MTSGVSAVAETRAVNRPSSTSPFRLAVIGCGAITKGFHLPVLAGHEGIRVVALVDRDTTRAGELASAYGIPTVLGDDANLVPRLGRWSGSFARRQRTTLVADRPRGPWATRVCRKADDGDHG